jgi:hypothetical protein
VANQQTQITQLQQQVATLGTQVAILAAPSSTPTPSPVPLTPTTTATPVPVADLYEPNDTSSTAASLGTLSEGQSRTVFANFHAGTDVEDWYQVRAQEVSSGCLFGNETFTLRARLTRVPTGSDYDLAMYRTVPTSTPQVSTLPGNLAEEVAFSYSGLCLEDNSSDFYVQVRRVGGAPTNANYTLVLSFSQP